MTFSGEKLRQIRLSRGLSQRDLPVAHDTISRIESGRRKPHPSTLRKLAAALHCEVSDFFEEAAPSPKALPAPPSLEWAMTAPDEEYEAWTRAASSPDLHKVWIALSKVAEGMEEGAELRTYADRVQKAVDQFVRLEGISGWRVREPRREATHEEKDGREAG